ncbi:MAG: class I SAM-dependent methyltransferase [Aggregatilineales bacterium]
MGVKLHVGCGGDIKAGYVNIDEFNPKADLQLSIQALNYPDNSIEQIEGYMVLEHLSPQDALAFVQNAHRMLHPGGRLVLEVPDLAKIARLLLIFADDAEYLDDGAFGLRGVFGEPTQHMTVGDYHKWGYTPATARRLMHRGGFRQFSISDGLSHNFPLRDMRIEAVK